MDDFAPIGALLAELDRLADTVRHQALVLDRFHPGMAAGALDPDHRPRRELLAQRRSAAVMYAANLIVGDCLRDQPSDP